MPSIKQLQLAVRSEFPSSPVQFLAANAGVLFTGATVLSGSASEWDTTYRVNVLGVVNTLKCFVPAMAVQPERSLVEITASVAGVMWGGNGPYGTSKLASLGVAEALWQELRLMPSKPLQRVSLDVLCPALVKTELLQSGEAATGGKILAEHASSGDATSELTVAGFRSMWGKAMSPEFAAAQVFEHARQGKFYCILDNELERDGMSLGVQDTIADRQRAMLSGDIATHFTARARFGAAAKL